MNKHIFSLVLITTCLLFIQKSYTQNRPQFPVVISVFNNGTQLPGQGKLGMFTSPIHPGFSIGTEYTYNNKPTHQWFQTAHAAYFFHQYAQHGIQLFSEVGYRYRMKKGPYFGSKLGLGYMHSIPEAQVFKLNDEGVYDKKTNLGRSQFMGSFAIHAGYEFQKSRPFSIFLNYQFFAQLVFVNEYVPVLPNSALHLGVTFHPFTKSKD